MAKFEKKYSIEELKILFAKGGCELLQDYYSNVVKPVIYRCECETVSKISINAFLKGGRCRKCGGKKIGRKNTLTYDYVKQKFDDQGYKLLSSIYTKAHDSLAVECPQGHIVNMTYANFSQGNRCRKCYFSRCKKSKPPLKRPTPIRHTFESVKENFTNEGYQLISQTYSNVTIPLDCICPKGHSIKIRYATFLRGARCIECHRNNMRGENHPRWNPDRVNLKKNQKYASLCRTFVRRTLRAINQSKEKKSTAYLKYLPCDLKSHLENHPNIETIGNQKWVPDHIFPVKAFLDYGITDISLINCLDNLQPLTESENHIKSGNYNKKEFLEFLNSKGININ